MTMGGEPPHPPHPSVEDTMDTSLEHYVPPPLKPYRTQSAIKFDGWQNETALQTLLPCYPAPATIQSPVSDPKQVIGSTTTQFWPPGIEGKQRQWPTPAPLSELDTLRAEIQQLQQETDAAIVQL